jgi:hypothetical protein
MVTNNKKNSKTIINPPGGLTSINKPPKFNYAKHNPKGGIAAAMKQPSNADGDRINCH